MKPSPVDEMVKAGFIQHGYHGCFDLLLHSANHEALARLETVKFWFDWFRGRPIIKVEDWTTFKKLRELKHIAPWPGEKELEIKIELRQLQQIFNNWCR